MALREPDRLLSANLDRRIAADLTDAHELIAAKTNASVLRRLVAGGDTKGRV